MGELKEFQHLKLPLEEILSATNNFDDKNRIGTGGFGPVYKGSLSHSKGQGIVACKRLNRASRSGQGETQFLKEITTLPLYTHENIISLLGFCNDGKERILIYEHASRGSLDRYLDAEALSWRQRLKICFEAAKGLRHLHDPRGTSGILIHCDIKSANILLNENWDAKISDFGLSRFGNQNSSFLISEIDGTHGYCDPVYWNTNVLMKESDVYSFGVVLFEVLCGEVCCKIINNEFVSLVPTWMQMYKDEKLEQIIFEGIKQKMDQESLKIFADIAYRCLNTSRELRPTMNTVVSELEVALEAQKRSEGQEELIDYEEMCRSAVPSLTYRSKAELNVLLSKGVLLNNGKTFFLVNENREHCEVISIADCLPSVPPSGEFTSSSDSRFAVGCYYGKKFTARVRTQFLTPMIAYKVSLLFKDYFGLDLRRQLFMKLKYKLPETKPSTVYLANEGEDEWMRAELLVLISDRRSVNLEIMFSSNVQLKIQGIEFQPLEKVKVEVLEDETIDSDTYWEQKLPNDYKEIIKLAKHSVPETTMKDLYFSLCRGFLINNGDQWFSLSKNGKKCYMLPARSVLMEEEFKEEFKLISEPGSRFDEVAHVTSFNFRVGCKFEPQILSSQTTYAAYLVYKLPMVEGALVCRVKVTMEDVSEDEWVDHEDNLYYYVSLTRAQTPVITRLTKHDQDINNLLNRPQMKYEPRLREDGFMEVQIWEYQTSATSETISMQLMFWNRSSDKGTKDIIVQGIEIKPV